MRTCNRPGCGWRAIAPSAAAAVKQYARHVLEAHSTEVEADVPEGMVQVRSGEDDEWTTMTVEEAREFHAGLHGGETDE